MLDMKICSMDVVQAKEKERGLDVAHREQALVEPKILGEGMDKLCSVRVTKDNVAAQHISKDNVHTNPGINTDIK
eukprot:12428067-Karenia_brevis.AAC.1